MQRIKSPRVRFAKAADRPIFRTLINDLVVENEKYGSEVTPSDNNLDGACMMFDTYLENPDRGFVLMVGQECFIVAVTDDPASKDDPEIRPCKIGAVYVSPRLRKQGIGVKLYKKAFDELRKRGFTVAFGTTPAGNIGNIETAKKLGCEIHSVIISKNLVEEPV